MQRGRRTDLYTSKTGRPSRIQRTSNCHDLEKEMKWILAWTEMKHHGPTGPPSPDSPENPTRVARDRAQKKVTEKLFNSLLF
ncbi:unnamed protein product [Cochlearia groenlandica]